MLLGLEYRIKDLESGDKDISLSLSSEHLQDAVGDLDADLSGSSARIEARLYMHGSVVQCDGWLRGQLLIPCQRCLEPAPIPVEVRLHTVYSAASSASSGKNADSVDDDDVDYAHHDGETVDLWPLLREDLILSVPITVLCKEDCRGLCPTCGVDRNTTLCACQPSAALSPFAGLRSLKLPT